MLVSWVLNYLTARPQYVWLQNSASETVLCSTGAHKELFCHPFCLPYTHLTFNVILTPVFFRNFLMTQLLLAALGVVVRGSIGAQSMTVNWSDLNHLRLNISKTKEMVLDFRRKRPKPDPTSIQGTEVELVSCYRCTAGQQAGLVQPHGGSLQKGSQQAVFFKKVALF